MVPARALSWHPGTGQDPGATDLFGLPWVGSLTSVASSSGTYKSQGLLHPDMRWFATAPERITASVHRKQLVFKVMAPGHLEAMKGDLFTMVLPPLGNLKP